MNSSFAFKFLTILVVVIGPGIIEGFSRNVPSLRSTAQRVIDDIRDLKEPHPAGTARTPRVNGGRIARPNEYPYMAAIYVRVRNTPVFSFSCGGSIYNKNYTITAGHCLQKADGQRLEAKDVRVSVGINKVRIFMHESSNELLPVFQTFIHPSFDTTTLYFVTNDIAMIRLANPLTYTSTIKKLRVASPKEASMDGIGDVTGWGRTEIFYPHTRPGDSSGLPVSLELKTARLRIISNSLCTIRHFSIVPQTILCVGSEGLLDTQSACYGDSGGPLACPGPSGPYLCGVVSTGVGCGLRFTPGFYTKVSEYTAWIQRIGGTQ